MSTCCWKNGADKLALRRVDTNLQLKKKNDEISAKRNKSGMPVFSLVYEIPPFVAQDQPVVISFIKPYYPPTNFLYWTKIPSSCILNLLI
jgi:hypothetical protein